MGDPARISLSLLEVESPQGGIRPFEDGGGGVQVEPGERVRGRVVVEVVEPLEFREFHVRFLWRTEGKGNRVTGEGGTEVLARDGVWEGGTTREFSFEVKVPGGPLSYEGRLLRVLWVLEARVDRSLLKSDLIASIPIRLVGSPDPESASLGPVPQEKERLEAVKKGRAAAWVGVGSVFLVMGVIYGAASSWELATPGRITTGLLIGGGLVISLRGWWGRLARGKLGEPTVQLSTTELRVGEEIRFAVSIRPEQRTELRSLEAILECEERVVHGHGQYQSRHKRTVFEQRLVLARDMVIHPHRGFKKKGTVTLPPGASPSFGAPYNQVIWWLRFRGDIVGWPDWEEPVLLTVWP